MESKKVLDEIDQKILVFIVTYINKHQYPPSFREIGDALELKSTASVHTRVNRLIALKYLETDIHYTNRARALRVPGYKLVKIEDDRNKEN